MSPDDAARPPTAPIYKKEANSRSTELREAHINDDDDDDDDYDYDDDDYDYDDGDDDDDDDDDLREFAAPLMHDILRVTMTLGPLWPMVALRSISYH